MDGARWRIGNGRRVRLDVDPWLPKSNGFRPVGVSSEGVGLRVCDVINATQHVWKMEVIDAVMQEEDAKAVRLIPLPCSDMEDRWVWHFSNRGVYSVSSGYESALRLKRQGSTQGITGGESSMRDDHKKVWNKVWSLPVPNKIKVFVWKCINGILPIRENLLRRKVTREMLCLNCKGDCETFPHLFLECRFAHVMWKSSPFGYVPSMNGQTSILAWFDKLIDRWKGTDDGGYMLTLAAMIMWRIWKCRNEVLFNGADPNPSQMVVVAVKEAEEFILAMREQIQEPRQPRVGSGELAQCWQKPSCGKLKFNVDGAWVSRSYGLAEAEAEAGAGIVVRDSNGSFVAARSLNLGVVGSPLCAEALAWRAAFDFAGLLGLGSLVMEGDSQLLVRCIRGEIACPTEVEVVVEDIRRYRNMVRECEVVFVRRSANGVADALAKDGLRGPGVRTWESRPPDWLLFPLGKDNRLISCI